jgi:integrase
MGKLTVASVRGLTKPGRYADGGGLFLDVRGGSRAWVYRYQLANRERLMSLGNADEISLAEARSRHSAARTLVLDRRDPLAERSRARAEKQAERVVTFAEAAQAYIEAHRAGWHGQTEGLWRRSLAAYVIPAFGATPVDRVATDDVLRVLSPIWSLKSETATILRNRIELVLSYAKSRGWRSGENVARWRDHLANLMPRPGKVHRVEHRPAMDWRDAPALMAELGGGGPGVAAKCMRFLVLTATRSGEARGCRWSEIDLEQKLWTIPAERMTKTGREHRVPLSDAAMAILAEAAEVRTGDVVFWGRAGEIADSTLSVLLRRLGHADITVHGFRSTFRDWAADHGQPADLAEMALAHTVGNAVERSYRRSDVLDRRRALMEQWARFLIPSGAVVVPIHVAA